MNFKVKTMITLKKFSDSIYEVSYNEKYIGDFLVGEDGDWAYWPRPIVGYMSEEMLLAIGNSLRVLNK